MDEETHRLLGEARGSLHFALLQMDALLAGDAPGFRDEWLPVRDPDTGVRLCDLNRARGTMRFVYRWHGEKRECTVAC